MSIKKEYAINFSARSSDVINNLDKPNKATADANISIKLSKPKLNNVVEFSFTPKKIAKHPSTKL